MSAWFGNLKIAAKVTLAPALAIVGLIGLAGAAYYVFDGLASDFHYLNDTAFARFGEGEKLQNSVSRVHAQLYSVISLAANANDAKSVAARADTAAKELPGIVQRGEAVRAMVDNPDDVKALTAALADYVKDAQGALDMAQVDAAMGLLLMGTVQDEFDKLNDRLDVFTTASDHGRSQTFETAIHSIDGARVAFLLSALCATGLAIAAAFVVARAIGQPVGALTVIMGTLASGTTDVAVPYAERRDELGAMARAVAIFRENAVERASLAVSHEREQEAGLRRARHLEIRVRDFDGKVSGILAGFTSAAQDMKAAAEGMTATAEQTSRQAATVATAAEQASANVQTVSAAEELTSSVGEIGRQVSESTKIASQAVAEANRTDATVRGLSRAAEKIGDVVKLISDIASQTNLLALNATIEAARAGDAGKGFAVVASEVKSLANQTAKATGEISGQVAAMRDATSEVVQAIQGIGGTIGTINEIATTIASAVEEQGAATQEIARNVQEAAQGTGQVSSNIVGVNQAATETGGAAGRVLIAAGELGTQAETLRTHVDKFLADIRAA